MRTSWLPMFSVGLLAIVVSGCEERRVIDANTTKPTPEADGAKARKETVRPAEDHSLTIAEYLAKGMPATDREWATPDYENAARILESLAQTDALRLPRHGSKKSGELFKRIVADQNFDLVRNPNLPAENRALMSADLAGPVKRIMLIYLEATNRGPPFDSELVDLLAFMLKWALVTANNANEYVASLPPDDPKIEIRKDGIVKAKNGMATMVNGTMITFSERKFYRVSELVRLAQQVRLVLPKLLKELPTETQKEIPIRLQSMANEESDAELKAALFDLLESIKAT